MELFDKKFVYLEWDDKLEGKEVFVADCLADLRRRVDNNDHHGYSERVVESCVEFPFRVSSGITFAMAYYDPLYEYKLAYNQGKKVEVFGFVGISRAWVEVTDDWKWSENYEYRVKPESEHRAMPERTKRRMTNRELAKWIAQGNGQVKDINSSTITSRGLMYDEGDDDKPCPDYLVIRGFDETEWHAPEVEE